MPIKKKSKKESEVAQQYPVDAAVDRISECAMEIGQDVRDVATALATLRTKVDSIVEEAEYQAQQVSKEHAAQVASLDAELKDAKADLAKAEKKLGTILYTVS